ncbi:MAG: hypothetical protein ABR577_06580 [Pyrinomonadaceae bacterium]
MKRLIGTVFIVALVAASVCAQGKGVDKQNERIRDTGTDRGPANNGTKQDVGAGRGFDFGSGRTQPEPPLPNPYRLVARREAVLKAIEELMRDRKLIMDTAASKATEGLLVSQPFTFIKGAVVSQSELSRYAELPEASSRGWTRGRYTLIVEAQSLDPVHTNVSVNTKIEGRTDGATGAEWITLRSTGTAEQEFLRALVEGITGSSVPSSIAPKRLKQETRQK